MVIVLTGKNSFALQKELQKKIAEFRNEYGDSVERFDASEIATVDAVLDGNLDPFIKAYLLWGK